MRLGLLVAALGGILLLISSRADIRDRKQRTTTLTGLLLLFWVGLTLFGFSYFSISRSAYVMSAFYLAQQFVAGVCAAMLIFLFWPDGAKTMLTISGIALVGFDLYSFAHYDLRHLAPAIRLFCMGNGLLIGIAVASAASRRRKGNVLEDRAV